MKRALKKREKAVLNNTPNSEEAPVEEKMNDTNAKVTRRTRTHQAAMIGLAISMGATSLLVTRQSDQAQAAAPVGSQKAASSIPGMTETETKFATTKLESQTVVGESVAANPTIVEPTQVSQTPGLEAKWQMTNNSMAVEATSTATSANENSDYSRTAVATATNNLPVQPALHTDHQLPQTAQRVSAFEGVTGSNSTPEAIPSGEIPSNTVDAHLKAQQEFAINRLQEKSQRLKNSLPELQSQGRENLALTPSKTGIQEIKANNISVKPASVESKNVTDSSQEQLINRLKQNKEQANLSTVAPTAKVVAQVPVATYEVKPGDTLAEIANNYGTSVSEIVRFNKLTDPNELQINQKLIIPGVNSQENSWQGSSSSVNARVVKNNAVIANTNNSLTVPPALPSESQVVSGNASVSIPIPTGTQPPERPDTPAISSNSLNVPAPIKENQVQVSPKVPQSQISAIIPQALPTPGEAEALPTIPTISSESQGVGGNTPLPRNVARPENNSQPVQRASKPEGSDRLRSLQAEIDRLRDKYRTQQSGNVAAVPPALVEENVGLQEETGNTNGWNVPVAIKSPQDLTRYQTGAVQIPVPKPILPSYNNSETQRPININGVPKPVNEPTNPEFLPSQAASGLNSDRPGGGIKIAVPPARLNSNESLGKLRGTTVSPQMPPLAAVDRYLPQNIDENTNPVPSSSTSYIWPAKGVLTSGYGWRWGRMHRGIDIANSTGTPIYASSSGVVVQAGWNRGGYGNVVDIRHADGSLTRYGHNSRILVQVGQQVEQGQQIAAMGSTGFSTGPHSHFEIHPAGKGAINPIAFLPSRK
ncbi:peptidoglycan DD-metalloendopeptidase family protein [Anabaena sp. FACHB-1237]|uniref:peptidoglycan DD-metalloendopeptidase family protein n=1 Tax=Anabaena sp. FACHB-1237 TaxID=2692769 RepID=UPI0016807A2D|nr:peptidoglycan DD-metalloendopeptidase family protein [Anabaena sp. FACHB-1237]MBD2139397.1 peptidoglycan DD-metalloendopeptidase family protein [Anabaena sp. FACHB-1237]